jgi:hypothetical protein
MLVLSEQTSRQHWPCHSGLHNHRHSPSKERIKTFQTSLPDQKKKDQDKQIKKEKKSGSFVAAATENRASLPSPFPTTTTGKKLRHAKTHTHIQRLPGKTEDEEEEEEEEKLFVLYVRR